MPATEPLVCAVCLTADRQQLTQHAIACFETQTYRNAHLLILDTGKVPFEIPNGRHRDAYIFRCELPRQYSIGLLRNQANALEHRADIFVHFDSDDHSHPNRITEQVALLQASGADAVGYNEMLFWRSCEPRQSGDRSSTDIPVSRDDGAWLYSNPRPNYALGTSLAYWRKTWERSPFTDGPKPEGTSEYHHWFALNSGVRVESVTSFGGDISLPPSVVPPEQDGYHPRMIARIHGQNTGQYDLEKLIAGGSREWKRVPQWDQRVLDILEGK